MFQVSFFKFRGRRITPLQCGPFGLGFPVGHVLERRRDEFPRGRRHLPTFYIISCQEYRRHGPLLRRKETLGQHWAKVNPATATSSRKQETLERCWFKAGTTSTTSVSIGSTSRLFAADSPCACRLLRRFTPRPVAAQTSARGRSARGSRLGLCGGRLLANSTVNDLAQGADAVATRRRKTC